MQVYKKLEEPLRIQSLYGSRCLADPDFRTLARIDFLAGGLGFDAHHPRLLLALDGSNLTREHEVLKDLTDQHILMWLSLFLIRKGPLSPLMEEKTSG